MTASHDPVELLAELVRRPSITGDTASVQIFAERWLAARGVKAVNSKDGLTARIDRGGPPMLLLSHLDTVPPGEGWVSDPYGGEIVKGRLTGRGSTDAKGSAAAMCAAMAELSADKDFQGSMILYLSSNEEGEIPSAATVIGTLGPLGCAIVGEPTGLDVGVAQRGLLVLRLTARSEQAHAAHSTQPSSALLLAEDIVRICSMKFTKNDPDLGSVKITPVRLASGVADNVTPPVATAMLDIRTIPQYPHDQILERVRHASRHCEIEKVGTDWPPVATPKKHVLSAIALEVTGGKATAGFAASDWAFLGEVPAVKIGPGDSEDSHRPDESVSVLQVRKAARIYADAARKFFMKENETMRAGPPARRT